ncbi:MAG: alpha/beta hydrolase, partial [Alicyclobacillaceae bacterium]|nr:alpha/beta hydrolase [Alicyclobacillaceae bacterium]
AYVAAEWIREHAAALGADAAKIAVGGDSAGGNLAAVVSLINRDRGNPPFVGQLLIYPATELTGQPFPSKREFLQGYFLERDLLVWFQRNYLPNREDAGNPWASPLLASDLSGLPPAMIITAEYDPLRDEGEAYGSRLRESGVPVVTKRYDGMIHGFVSMLGLFPEAEQALQEAAAWLRNLYQTGVV